MFQIITICFSLSSQKQTVGQSSSLSGSGPKKDQCKNEEMRWRREGWKTIEVNYQTN